jgi:Rieske Fe-S protein
MYTSQGDQERTVLRCIKGRVPSIGTRMTSTRRNVSLATTYPDRKNNQKKSKASKGTASKKKTFMPHKEWWALSKGQRIMIREERKEKNVTERTVAAEEREKKVPAAEKDAPNPEVSAVVSRCQPSTNA